MELGEGEKYESSRAARDATERNREPVLEIEPGLFHFHFYKGVVSGFHLHFSFFSFFLILRFYHVIKSTIFKKTKCSTSRIIIYLMGLRRSSM